MTGFGKNGVVHPEPFDSLRACPEPVEGINSAKDL
jgi:hypothetical protein